MPVYNAEEYLEKAVDSIITVSYTHLDVYKRQSVSCANLKHLKIWDGSSL